MTKPVQLSLRWACILMMAFALATLVSHAARHTTWFKEHFYQKLLSGDENERLRAASILADVGAENHLLRGLQSDDERVSEMARRGLDHLWFHSAGQKAYEMMETAYQLAEEKKYAESIETLNRLLELYPNYVEALNRRAAALWQVGEYAKSRQDCERALSLNPNHYGAWQGLGVSQLQLGALDEACRSLETALHISPHDKIAKRCLKKVEELRHGIPAHKPARREADLL